MEITCHIRLWLCPSWKLIYILFLIHLFVFYVVNIIWKIVQTVTKMITRLTAQSLWLEFFWSSFAISTYSVSIGVHSVLISLFWLTFVLLTFTLLTSVLSILWGRENICQSVHIQILNESSLYIHIHLWYS